MEALYRGLADNSVGKVIEQMLRAGFVIVDEIGLAALDDTGAQLLLRLVPAAYERVPLGIASHWRFDQWGRFLPEQITALSLIDGLLHHSVVVLTEGESFRMREAWQKGGWSRNTKVLIAVRGVRTFGWPPVNVSRLVRSGHRPSYCGWVETEYGPPRTSSRASAVERPR